MRHFNPHNIENLLSNAPTADVSAPQATDSTSPVAVEQSVSEIVFPSFYLPGSGTPGDNNNKLKKHIRNELSKDIVTDTQKTTQSSDVTPIAVNNATTAVTTESEDDISNVSIPEPEQATPTNVEHLSPMFPGLTTDEECKSEEDKKQTTGHTDVLLSLTNNWPLIVTTILGTCVPSCGDEATDDNNAKVEYSSQACDYFVQELLYNCDYLLAESIADTIIDQLNVGLAGDKWTLNDVLQLDDDSVVVTEVNVALVVGKKFLHSLVRLLAIELSDPIIGGEEASERANKNKNVILLIQ